MSTEQLYSDLFGKGGPDEAARAAGEYPYFSPAHFFRLKGMDENDPSYEKAAGLAALHFRDSLQLQMTLYADRSESQSTLKEMKIPQPTAENATDLLFEPLHATDYFASQGIKLGKEVKEDDKLGKQLRSFTDWLKTMKRLPAAEIAARIPVDKEVEKMAEKSDKEVEVLTESMAEVLVDQGKNAKAIEIYEKLSLQNPAKNAYFASKIKELKNK